MNALLHQKCTPEIFAAVYKVYQSSVSLTKGKSVCLFSVILYSFVYSLLFRKMLILSIYCPYCQFYVKGIWLLQCPSKVVSNCTPQLKKLEQRNYKNIVLNLSLGKNSYYYLIYKTLLKYQFWKKSLRKNEHFFNIFDLTFGRDCYYIQPQIVLEITYD